MKKTAKEYLEAYQKIHDGQDPVLFEGIQKYNHGTFFNGSNFTKDLFSFVKSISEPMKSFSILDLGCGRAKHLYQRNIDGKTFYEHFGGKVQQYYCYDPGFKLYEKPPSDDSKFDFIVCSDVLEHIPDEYVDDTFNDMVKWSNKDSYIIASISGNAAVKTFHDGENLHCNVKPIEYWKDKIDQLDRRYVIVYKSGDVKFVATNFTSLISIT